MATSRASEMQPQASLPFRYGFGLARRILVVEEDGDTARMVAYQLERAGYDVLKCGSAAEALDLIDQMGLPDLAVVDVALPDMDGVEFCRRLLQFSSLPVIVLAAASEYEATVQALQCDAGGCIAESLESCELVARVQGAMRRLDEPNPAPSSVKAPSGSPNG
jgi:DNA-binding response OmpR family regulator